jgi:hypothetical protein
MRDDIVKSQRKNECDTRHVILLRHSERRLLLRKTESGFVLPSVEIPRWERLAENLTAAVKKEFGCDAACLFPLTNSSEATPQHKRYEVMESWNRAECVAGTTWQSIVSLTLESFEDGAEFQAVERCLEELARCDRPDSPFARKGWFVELRDWAANVIRPLGLELSGPFQQYNASPTFNLTRFETTGAAVWFKATGEPNRREFPITLRLANLFPTFMPEVVGTKPEWNGWLSREADGKSLGESKDVSLWEYAASEFAKLQIESRPESESILPLGAHDLRCNVLLAAIDPFFDVITRLMDQQTKITPSKLNREELSLLKVRIDDVLTLLSELGVSNTLGHLDLNPWNVVVANGKCTFLDWAEAYVGYPFFSLEYLLQHFRREVRAGIDCEADVIDAYEAPWRQLVSGARGDVALALTPLAAVFAFAVGTEIWKDEEQLRDPKIAGYMRSLVRRMNREAVQSMGRRSPCLS